MTMRRVTEQDLDTVLRHRGAMFAAMGMPAEPSAMAASRRFFTEAFARGRYHGWFIEDAGAVVAGGGVVLLEYQPGPRQKGLLRPFVVNMWTEEPCRRKGLARRLMETMVTWARAEGYGSLNLHASDEGRTLYESLGFRPTNEMRLIL
ncbi:MAG: GNAT family N-acetyltransferase [Bryobacteraceae bacterium]